MWNFLLLLVSKEEETPGGGLCRSGLFSKYRDLLALSVLYAQPPQPDPNSTRHAFVVLFTKDGDQRASIVYCSSVMVWKRLSA